MIRAYTSEGILFVGLTRKNLERLENGEPISMEMFDRNPKRVVIVFGETKPAIVQLLESQAGLEFADVHKAAAAADPL